MGVPRYWREIPQRYNLLGKKCSICSEIFFPPRVICPHCRRKSIGKMEDYQLTGEGTVETYTIIHDPPPHFEGEEPYVIAIIKLRDGCKIIAQIVDGKPDELKIGMHVKACFRKIQEDGKSGAIYYGYKFKKKD